ERIHIANLIGMGVLPTEFKDDEGWEELGLDGTETYDVEGIDSIEPRKDLTVTARHDNGDVTEFDITARLDTEIQVDYYRHGGILQYVLRNKIQDVEPATV
ncbi:MAG: aconitate hydratase, partial [bacterium]